MRAVVIALVFFWGVLVPPFVFRVESVAAEPVITPGQATTRVTAPRDAEGYVDFLAAMDAHLSTGIRHEDNAHVLLLEALGICDGATPFTNALRRKHGLLDWSPGALQFARVSGKDIGSLEASHTVRWTRDELPAMADLLDSNARSLALIAQASRQPHYYRPWPRTSPVDTTWGQLLPDVQTYREVARQLWSRVLLHTGEGRIAEARTDLMTMHRLARLTSRGGCLIEVLVSLSMEQMACQAADQWALSPGVTADELSRYRTEYAALPKFADLSEQLDYAERFMTLDLVQEMARGRMTLAGAGLELQFVLGGNGPTPPPIPVVEQPPPAKPTEKPKDIVPRLIEQGIDWNTVTRALNVTFDEVVALARLKHLERETRFKEFKARRAKQTADAITPEALAAAALATPQARGEVVGLLLFEIINQTLQRPANSIDIANTRRDVRLAGIAIREHFLRAGSYPADDAALVPTVLRSLPDDPFSSQPLRYLRTPEGFVMFSVGLNHRDDSGFGVPNGINGDGPDDIAFSDPAPTP